MKAQKLVNREQSLDEFFAENSKDFRRMAIYILSRWKAPNDVSIEDVEQELRIAAWRAKRKYDPARGVTPERYITFQAINKAKRWVHQQRRGRDDKSVGRFDLLTDDGQMVDRSSGEAAQETDAIRRSELESAIDSCTSTREAICLAVFFREEDTRAAAKVIYENAELRRLCQVRSMLDAKRAVKRTVEEHACRR